MRADVQVLSLHAALLHADSPSASRSAVAVLFDGEQNVNLATSAQKRLRFREVHVFRHKDHLGSANRREQGKRPRTKHHTPKAVNKKKGPPSACKKAL